jgi:hypothetical protein
MTHYGGGYEPDEHGSFFVYAKAQTARRAKVIALKWFRRNEGWRWKSEMEWGENPFTGMHAERVPEGGDE